jgi:hypothetical protein
VTAVKERWLQCVLLVACVLVLSFDLATPVSCQGGCVPPLVTPGYMDPITITNGSWAPATNVTVKIDERYFLWGPTVVNRIWAGQVKWNSTLTCSGVFFDDFEAVVFDQDDYANPPPFHHHYWFVAVPAPNPDGSPRNGEMQSFIGFGGRVVGAITRIHPNLAFNPQSSDPSLFNYFGTHETGHTFNLKDCLSTTTPQCVTGQLTIMSGHGSTAFNEAGPNSCDFNAVAKIYCPPTPTPTPNNEAECAGSGNFWNFASGGCFPTPQIEADCQDYGWYWNFTDGYCQDTPWCTQDFEICEPPTYWSNWACSCILNPSPIVIDVLGNGFRLTNHHGGVPFDLNSDGSKELLSWTSVGSDDSWLVLDRNGNGTIDDGSELFGNFTSQPQSTEKNGFLALTEFDKSANGGNGDGLITSSDSVFASLRLWQDSNQNGVSEASELHTLLALNLSAGTALQTIEVH